MINDIVNKNILFDNNISISDLSNMLSGLFCKGIDYGDIYFQNSINESLFLEDNKIKNYFINNISGVGIRIIFGDQTSFAYSNDISKKSIFDSINKVKLMYKNNFFDCKKDIFFSSIKNNYYDSKSPVNYLINKDKVNLLLYLNDYIRKIDSRINYVSLNMSSTYDVILVLSTDGFCIGDVRPLISLSIKVQLEKDGFSEFGISGGGGRYSYNTLISDNYSLVKYWADEAVRIGVNNLYAKFAPAGNFPIILGAGWPGVLLHEAVGHGLEGDFVRKGISIYSKNINKKVSSSLCTVIDDGTLLNLRGSLNIDDEGTFTKKNVLIKNGILKSFMLDKLNARLLNLNSTGNARRESYLHLPVPRMTNTYLLSGSSSICDLLNSVDYGIYVANLSGGQVDITSGKFVFTILEGYLIENGKISFPIKGATLIGSGIEIMNKVSMVANDLRFDCGVGTCGKENQNVPVGVGQPSLKIDSMIIGGINS